MKICCKPAVKATPKKTSPKPKLSSKAKSPKKTAYQREIEKFRKDYLQGLLKYEQSPIREPEEIAALRYFEPKTKFRFQADFEPLTGEKAEDMLATDGSKAPFAKYGWVTFSNGSTTHKLTVYQRVHDQFRFFFIPFNDLSNGDSTYGGGRYVEFTPEKVKDGRVEIDFNKSYNPWCHYVPKFPCPIPPAGNFLEIAVLAGEMKYAGSSK